MDKDAYSILDTYFRDHFYPFTKHHIDSYREFIRKYIPDVVKSYNPITMVKFTNNKNKDDLELRVEIFIGGLDSTSLYVDRPTMVDADGNFVILTPQDARLKNLTYLTNLYADIVVRYTIGSEKKIIMKPFKNILIGQIPLMIHSDGCILHQQGPRVLRAFDECTFDQGGYFIIDGKEKVVISQERMVTNRLFVEQSKDPRFKYRGWIRSTTESGEASLLPKTMEFFMLDPNANKSLIADDDTKIKTKFKKMEAGDGDDGDDGDDDEGGESKQNASIRIKYRGAILVSIPNIKNGKNSHKIPLFQLFRCLGVESDKDILEHIFGDITTTALSQEYIDFIMPSIRHCADKNINIFSQEDAVDNIKNNVRYNSKEYVHRILTHDVFPNMGDDYHKKARYLGYTVKYMIEMILNVKPMINRDDYGYKRIDLSGFLLSQLFHNIYKHFRKNCQDVIDQEYHLGPWRNTGNFEEMLRPDNIQKIINPSFITERMKRSLKGLWGSSDSDEKQEKVQDLSRISYIGFLSNLRRVNTPLDRTIKLTTPHRLNAQQWGIVCPFETPDGASIGYLKNLALLGQVSFGTDPHILIDEDDNCLIDIGLISLEYISPSQGHLLTKVFLNGEWIGCVKTPQDFTYKLRLLRRTGLINIFTSVAWKISLNEVRVQTDTGRGCRPLIIIENSKHRLPTNYTELSWFDLVFGTLVDPKKRTEQQYYKTFYYSPYTLPQFSNISRQGEAIWKELEKYQCSIEFVDIEESDTRMVAMYPKDITAHTTHLEIHPSTILSVVTSNIPLSNHNFAARNIFYGAQSKQAIGIYMSNYSKRFDTTGYILHYSQKALVTTKNSHYIANDKLPAGYNIIVAVATYTGYNQEDGIIINKNSLDRGLFQCTSYKSYSAQETSQNKYDYTMIANPLKLKEDLKVDIDNLKSDEIYALLDDRGIAIPESFITKGSKLAVVGMVRVTEELRKIQSGVKTETKLVKTYKDMSLASGIHHYGSIDKTYSDHSGSSSDYNRVCKVRFRKIRRPELGDKLCSRHGQKGVIGMILPEEDMPFTKDGIVPDIIINPHAIPSRMTIGHLVECVFSKVCTLEGGIGDGTVFIPIDYEKLGKDLEKYKFEKNGNEVLYNGKTGKQLETAIFIGPTYYLRLKHMVADKMHSRDKGPKDQLTRQPPSGRSNEGGLRIGEMERDILMSYGFSQFSKESVMERSDKYKWSVCKSCGRTSIYNPIKAIYDCVGCKSQDIALIETPYTFKLMVQELETMGITARLITDDLEHIEESKSDGSEASDDSEAQSGGMINNILSDNDSIGYSGGEDSEVEGYEDDGDDGDSEAGDREDEEEEDSEAGDREDEEEEDSEAGEAEGSGEQEGDDDESSIVSRIHDDGDSDGDLSESGGGGDDVNGGDNRESSEDKYENLVKTIII